MSILDNMLNAAGISSAGYQPEIGAGGPRQPRSISPTGTPGVNQGGGDGGTLRRVMAGIPITSIAAGAAPNVAVPVNELFQMQKMMWSVAAQALHLTQITTGTKPLNISPSPISGNCFSEQAVNNDLSGYTALPGVGITISVTNTTASAVVLSGGFFGWSLL